MNYANYKIFLDMHDISAQTSLAAKQGDTGRKIFATLTERGVPFIIGENCTAVFTAKKPDGNIVFNNCTIENNIICYTFTPQTTAAAGKLDCEIRLYDEGNFLITSPRFNIIVAAAVYNDGDEIESTSEVTTLTSLISEATALINDVNSKLENGDFVPKLVIGEVKTLPAGSNATASITGSGEAPILNLGIPMGERGQAEGLIPDAELSLDCTKPVQNKVITQALNDKQPVGSYVQYAAQELSDEEKAQARANIGAGVSSFDGNYSSLSGKPTIDAELSGSSTNAVQNKTVNAALGDKVSKESGKGLSTNDFTDEEKAKLAGIEARANKYVLADGAVTEAKIADNSVTQQYQFALPYTGWSNKGNGTYTNTVNIPGIKKEWNGIIYARRGTSTGGGADNFALTGAAFDLDKEQIDKLLACYISADDTLFLYASEPITRKTDMLLEVHKK